MLCQFALDADDTFPRHHGSCVSQATPMLVFERTFDNSEPPSLNLLLARQVVTREPRCARSN